MDKDDVRRIYTYIHTYNGVSVSHKKNEIMTIAATWMDLEIIMLREVSLRKTNASLICRI